MCRLRDGAETVDSRFGIRHKLRALSDDVRRQAPRVSTSIVLSHALTGGGISVTFAWPGAVLSLPGRSCVRQHHIPLHCHTRKLHS